MLSGSNEPEFKSSISATLLPNARAMAETFQSRGFKVVSGGMDNHLFLLDLIDKTLRAKMQMRHWVLPI